MSTLSMGIEEILDRIDTSELVGFNRENFLIYCHYMIFQDGPQPSVVLEDYYRSLYKCIEMLYEEQLQFAYYEQSVPTGG